MGACLGLHDRTFTFDALIYIIQRTGWGILALEQSGVDVWGLTALLFLTAGVLNFENMGKYAS